MSKINDFERAMHTPDVGLVGAARWPFKVYSQENRGHPHTHVHPHTHTHTYIYTHTHVRRHKLPKKVIRGGLHFIQQRGLGLVETKCRHHTALDMSICVCLYIFHSYHNFIV